MSLLTVGVGDCKVSDCAESVLATYALGSCIAVAIHDPVAAVAGLLHFMLPESSLNPDKAGQNPFMFADTGIPLLFHAAYGLGAEKRRLRADDLMARFEDIRRAEQLDETAAEMIRRAYV